MIEGVRILDIKEIKDRRGFLAEIFRQDWKDFVGKDRIAQANISVILPGVVKAWHRHRRGQVDYFVVLNGTIKLCAYEGKKKLFSEIMLTGDKLQIARIPGHYWHGLKNMSPFPTTYIYFVTKLYDYKNPDEGRKEWDDKGIGYDWKEEYNDHHSEQD